MANKNLGKHSLRFFFRKQLLLLTGVITLGFGALVGYYYVDGLDIGTRKGLMVIGSHYAELYVKGEFKGVSLESNEFSIYIGEENLPEYIRLVFPQSSFENYKLVKGFLKESEERSIILLTALPIDDGVRQLFSVYHFKHKENHVVPPPMVRQTVALVSIIVFLILLVMVLWIAQRFIRKVLNPMEALAHMAGNIDKGIVSSQYPIVNDLSEVGQVAQALVQGIERIHRVHITEKEFLQNASHELRTPITVVGTGLDIIERRKAMGRDDFDQPLIHIRQAVNSMKETTEALLWLSRNDSSEEKGTNTESNFAITYFSQDSVDEIFVYDTIKELVEELNYLINSRDVNVYIDLQAKNLVFEDPVLIRIILTNLIRNAFEHTFQGEVIIAIEQTSITVTDSGIGLNDSIELEGRGVSGSNSFGLGLDIVNRIVDRKGWSLNMMKNPNGGCIAKINWKK